MMTTEDTSPLSAKRSNVSCARVARWVEGGNIALVRALPHSSYTSLHRLDDLRLLLNSSFSLKLKAHPVMQRDDVVKNVKQFCGELLDRCVPNGWKTTLRVSHACLTTRVAVASSLFSLRKLLASPKPSSARYVRNMGAAQADLDPLFAMFCSQEIGKQFKQGWDKGYWSQVENFTPPTKSNLWAQSMGTYRERAIDGDMSRDKFLRWAGGTVTSPIRRVVRAKAIQTGGKWRVITLSDPMLANLLPVHRTLYNALSKKEWLLRGEATQDRFASFGRKEGEVFVSGDYESATDNLNINLSELILRRLLSLATHIPIRVREECLASLRMTFVDKTNREIGQHRRGQLMGSPLSFPLLCLSNYLTFRYAIRRDVPVKINGDDIIFRCTPQEKNDWFACVKLSGLVVSPGKTLVHGRVFSLNSTYFLALDSGARLAPHFRTSCYYRKCEDMGALAGRVAQIKRDLVAGELRQIGLRVLLRENLTMIYTAQGSFGRRFEVSIPRGVLRALRLDDRESFYLSMPGEPPPIESYKEHRQDLIPAEWRKDVRAFRGENIISNDRVAKEFVSKSWTSPLIHESKDDYWARVRDDSHRYVPFSMKALSLYRRYAGRHYVPVIPPFRRTKEKFWVERPSEGPMGPVAFVKGGFVK